MIAYDREVLLDVITHHWPTANAACLCGWSEIGLRFPTHVADVYEERVRDLQVITPEELGVAMSEEFSFLVSTPANWETSGTAILEKIREGREA